MTAIQLIEWQLDLWDKTIDEYRELWKETTDTMERNEYIAKIVELQTQKGILISVRERLEAVDDANNEIRT